VCDVPLCCVLCVNCRQLIDMQWSLGMSVASSNCRNLNSPFVTVQLRVAEWSGNVTERSFEMSLSEFKVCIETAVVSGWVQVR